MKFSTWEEAAQHGKVVVADFGYTKDRHGNLVRAEIVKEPGKDGVIVYRRTVREIRKAKPSEIDSTFGWRVG